MSAPKDLELEQRIAERTQQIARAKREWEGTFDAIRDPIAMQDGFVIRRANLEYSRRAGLPIREVIGKKCHQVLAGRDDPCPGCPLLAATNPQSELQIKDARFQVSAFPMSFESERWSAVLSYRDVTLQRALEEQLKETERLASLGQLASGAAHEINNPLGFLISNISTLKNELSESGASGAGEWAEMLNDALDGARRIADIVKHLRVLSGTGAQARGLARLDDIVKRAVLAVAGKDHRVTLALSSSGDIETAAAPLQEALEHVVRNARQAVDDDIAVSVSTRDEADDVVVRVVDLGVGIPPEVLPHVFEPFFTTRSVGQGTGLGLTATWGIVQQLNGTIRIASAPGQGTAVEVKLPRRSRGTEGAGVGRGRYA
jgi:C4-dicarboxylate-specific signal transduction histidine kinase